MMIVLVYNAPLFSKEKLKIALKNFTQALLTSSTWDMLLIANICSMTTSRNCWKLKQLFLKIFILQGKCPWKIENRCGKTHQKLKFFHFQWYMVYTMSVPFIPYTIPSLGCSQLFHRLPNLAQDQISMISECWTILLKQRNLWLFFVFHLTLNHQPPKISNLKLHQCGILKLWKLYNVRGIFLEILVKNHFANLMYVTWCTTPCTFDIINFLRVHWTSHYCS